MTLDLDAGTLSFSKNGSNLGVAFDGLAGELYPAVAFYTHNQRVCLVRSAFRCPGAGVAVAGSPREAGVDDVADVAHIMCCMRARAPLPAMLISEARMPTCTRGWATARAAA